MRVWLHGDLLFFFSFHPAYAVCASGQKGTEAKGKYVTDEVKISKVEETHPLPIVTLLFCGEQPTFTR